MSCKISAQIPQTLKALEREYRRQQIEQVPKGKDHVHATCSLAYLYGRIWLPKCGKFRAPSDRGNASRCNILKGEFQQLRGAIHTSYLGVWRLSLHATTTK